VINQLVKYFYYFRS